MYSRGVPEYQEEFARRHMDTSPGKKVHARSTTHKDPIFPTMEYIVSKADYEIVHPRGWSSC